jgi:hypothetical protein
MKYIAFVSVVAFCAGLAVQPVMSQNRINYSGTTWSNPIFHDGGLSPVIGVHNIQILRANNQHPDASNGDGWTYNHQPMLAYWQGQFWLHYLSDPRSEHVPPGRTMLMTSVDGYHWTNPIVLFPPYKVPDGYTKVDHPGEVAKHLIAVMHQRVGFYVSESGKLIAIGNYGVVLDDKDDPNDGNGIGRVVREIKKDGKFGSIYFIYYNHGFSEKNTDYSNYKKSHDKSFVRACDEILANPLYRMQWVEEADRNDPLIPLNKPYKAFDDYTLPDGRIVCLWKHALTSISTDGGNTWAEPVLRAKGFVTSNAKIWGQRLSDGSYATVYNPAEYRWPLAISLSSDGLNYTTLNLVHGEVTPLRYGGIYKSYGPQYTRGIQEGNGTPPDGNLWVAYSMNKEDMWVSRITVPVRIDATAQVNEDFTRYHNLNELSDWNIYSPLWAPVSLDGKWLCLQDKDPFNYAKVERKIPTSKALKVDFDVEAGQNNQGLFQIEFLDDNGTACTRLVFNSNGEFLVKSGARYGTLMRHYDADKIYHITAELSVENRNIMVYIDGKKVGVYMFDAPIAAIDRIVFRTGDRSLQPTSETLADQDFDLKGASDEAPLTLFKIANLKSGSDDIDASSVILKYKDYAHYADYFNNMEDENIVAAIPNKESSEWMEKNIPLFDCPQKDFEEIYYYRWWSLRKHIENTPAGYGMTEFMAPRTYADKYNLIASALGHHIYESRWLRDTTYLHQILRIWYRGNNGGAMIKMNKFSSWAPYAVYEMYKVQDDKDFLLNLRPDLEKEYARWKQTNRLSNGLYWQGDVQDGMEETISGGRHKRYARPTINSYMYGNAEALSVMESLAGNKNSAKEYALQADTLKHVIQRELWNVKQNFFETLRPDSSSNVREEIGYLPWYFNLPDADSYDNAWKQIMDEKGFSAPYGLTTAERRHPLFRTHGVGKCEWDGAIWPFATAQTLTAMANFMNNYPQQVLNDSVYFHQLELYVESQYHRGRPYIGEYLDEVTGYWLKGDQERSRYYNHSTFNDLVITGLIGLRPRADNTIEVNPLIPINKWNWFCLDNLRYHNHNITIMWDKEGNRYHQGKGFCIFVDGKQVAHKNKLQKVIIGNCL